VLSPFFFVLNPLPSPPRPPLPLFHSFLPSSLEFFEENDDLAACFDFFVPFAVFSSSSWFLRFFFVVLVVCSSSVKGVFGLAAASPPFPEDGLNFSSRLAFRFALAFKPADFVARGIFLLFLLRNFFETSSSSLCCSRERGMEREREREREMKRNEIVFVFLFQHNKSKKKYNDFVSCFQFHFCHIFCHLTFESQYFCPTQHQQQTTKRKVDKKS
jgi:hypothetical protein